MKIEGLYNTADVKTDTLEENALEQVRTMVDNEAFLGDSSVAIMPDAHWGSGAVIGFTMPFKNRLVPGTVGVDIGCGMLAVQLPGYNDISDSDHAAALDQNIRERVPTGRDTFDRGDYHMHDDFPWDLCQHKLETFARKWGECCNPLNTAEPFEYGPEYYDDLLERIGYSASAASNSMGTLGGGNHFIEIGMTASPFEKDSPYWAVIHSGSRGIGYTIANYWMERATQLRTTDTIREHFAEIPNEHTEYLQFDVETVSDKDLLDWIQGGMGEDYVDFEALKADFADDPERIGEIGEELKKPLQLTPANRGDDADLDYLEGDETVGYIMDMIFAQTYASESRWEMAEQVLEAWFEDFYPLDKWTEDDPERPHAAMLDSIESVHNYIDFNDITIRKGACSANEDERVVIPFNMKDGTLLCRGKGNASWNTSAPHGAGRVMGRREAHRTLNQGDFETEMNDAQVYLSEYPLDEAPAAYKKAEDIEAAIGSTVEVEERIKPLLNIKAE